MRMTSHKSKKKPQLNTPQYWSLFPRKRPKGYSCQAWMLNKYLNVALFLLTSFELMQKMLTCNWNLANNWPRYYNSSSQKKFALFSWEASTDISSEKITYSKLCVRHCSGWAVMWFVEYCPVNWVPRCLSRPSRTNIGTESIDDEKFYYKLQHGFQFHLLALVCS